MTTPSLKPAMPAGGILTQHVDQDFADFHAGRPLTQRVVIAVVQAGGTASENQERGRANKVKYESIHLVEITDPHEADRLRHLLTVTKAERGFLAKQPALFDATEAEQRESLLDMLKDWASEEDIDTGELDRRWVDYFGGAENAASETVQASRSVQQLKEFAYACGAIADPKPGEDDEDTEPEDDGLEDDLGSSAPAVSFQAGGDQ